MYVLMCEGPPSLDRTVAFLLLAARQRISRLCPPDTRPDSHTGRAQSRLAWLVFEAEAGLIVLDSAEIKRRTARLHTQGREGRCKHGR